MPVTRRAFLGGLSTGALAGSLPASARVAGANRDVRVAVVGLRGQGRTHIARFAALEHVRVVALCDVDRDVLAAQRAAFEKRYGYAIDGHGDVREVLDRDDVDVVSTATPNHWHALIGVWAVDAGKDAYIEKPISHNVWEGRQLVRAARRARRLVQGGTQSRSFPGIRAAVQYVQEGRLGAIEWVHAICYKPRPPIGKVGLGRPPESVDYSLWCGPAPFEPLRRRELHYDWHWQWATGNGDLGNQGIHQMDVARWVLGAEGLPPRVVSIGGRVGYDDDGETPNTQLVFYDYAGAPIVFEVRGLPRSKEQQADRKAWERGMDRVHPGVSIGVTVHCAQGRMVIDTAGARAFDRDGAQVAEFTGEGDHYANFLAAVRARDPSLLHADVEETHLSSALCHLGGISHLLGEHATAREAGEVAALHPAFERCWHDLREHLACNGIDGARPVLVAGRTLQVDQVSELIHGDHAANALLTRPYRDPFVVPAVV
ncbi:MAG TPA: Gfo/Idh/MocA family oxidoreductase [Planctomycetota bacterium]|nr:Gfo/Idh/MocA family oxidoreductase [Planctomycetota bacterium]